MIINALRFANAAPNIPKKGISKKFNNTLDAAPSARMMGIIYVFSSMQIFGNNKTYSPKKQYEINIIGKMIKPSTNSIPINLQPIISILAIQGIIAVNNIPKNPIMPKNKV